MMLKTPLSLKAEHDELHAQLGRAIEAGGATGEAAAKVAKALHPHFLKEEEYALPPLGLLPALAEGRILPEMEAAVAMTYRLKADLGQMLLEHKEIVAALKVLMEAANSDGNESASHFAEKLMLHAQTEEEVLYPASILVGEYLNLGLSEKMGR
ncbi:MAG: hemerythrin domain-containing protein [Methanothrix sp.]